MAGTASGTPPDRSADEPKGAEGQPVGDRFLRHVVPADRLPPGFAERMGRTAQAAAVPRPAATAILLRDSAAGPETLLLRRHRSSAFVPGAYVFPGGRVDAEDSAAALADRADIVPGEPAPSYWFAAVREVFEETGVLLAVNAAGQPAADATADSALARWRERLLVDQATLLELLADARLTATLGALVYCAHWITPVAEPRRYDTRFFLAPLPDGSTATADGREMSDAIWLTPDRALQRFDDGRLPMVFPTVRTLESLVGFGSVHDILASFRGRPVRSVLPRLVHTERGIGIEVDEEG